MKKILGVSREGFPFIFIAFMLFSVVFAFFPKTAMGFFVLWVWVIWFFRDPDRTPDSHNPFDIISPADGRVLGVDTTSCRYTSGTFKRISIFMSIFDVHVNRIPCDGTVEKIVYNEGKFLPAHVEKTSLENEQNAVILKTLKNETVVFVQIAGLIARRILWKIVPNQAVKQGERYGMIRFGSRMEVYVPEHFEVCVEKGQHVFSGKSLLAKEKQR